MISTQERVEVQRRPLQAFDPADLCVEAVPISHRRSHGQKLP
jgi:hypothetical protein